MEERRAKVERRHGRETCEDTGKKEQWNKSAEALVTEQQGYREEGRAGVQVQKKVESR